MRGRRQALIKLGLLPLAASALTHARPIASSRVAARYPTVVRGYRMRFPYDEGAHYDYRTEWWYITGWLERSGRGPCGFQITFFRSRPDIDDSNPSGFTPHQIIIAHAALSDRANGRLKHDQRVARAAFGLAGAEAGRTAVWLDSWSLVQDGADYRARIAARDFALELGFRRTTPPLLQGDRGYSRKGADARSASYYYSLPNLSVIGSVHENGDRTGVTGSAWLDHEWSSSYVAKDAEGWDWIGINLEGGGALMAFRMRSLRGEELWAGAGLRTANGEQTRYSPADVEFTPLRHWRSPRTGASYPVSWRVRVGTFEITLEPLMDDQESDSRASVGAVYWEGAVTAMRDGKLAGRGYLELTGYYRAMKL